MAAASSNARPKKTYNFSAAQAEVRLKKPQIEVELGKDGEGNDLGVIIVDPPALWPDEVQTLSRKAHFEEASRLLMGDEQYERWFAVGGTWGMFNAIVEGHQKATLGESGASKTS
ncbi:hypothetical protein C5E10_18035 [Pseudoclavibacter sp. RFBG4]|uniref:hypothetical protein n=1 Tax=Pseudoclavibacter sp. RFBG4 TaxID=2080575 RepID=UPI000CE74228|nr:hypothetical protein [Pseudoclavibacter sp. RFBG4]PPG25970.1 hypothetical protein C5E10_18035 [Pseudoclavibacter sp. RFBG4]